MQKRPNIIATLIIFIIVGVFFHHFLYGSNAQKATESNTITKSETCIEDDASLKLLG